MDEEYIVTVVLFESNVETRENTKKNCTYLNLRTNQFLSDIISRE